MTHPLLNTHFLTRGLSLKDAHHAYHKRRQALMTLCPFPIVIQGIPSSLNAHIPWLMTREPFYQDPLFFFLTGINQPGATLILNPLDKNKPELLLLPSKNTHMEFWEGPQLGVGDPQANKEATQITGIKIIKNTTDLWAIMTSIIKNQRSQTIGIFWHTNQRRRPVIKDHHYRFKLQCRRWLKTQENAISLVNISSQQYQLRLPLDSTDINHIKTANTMTTNTFKMIVNALPSCESETDVHAIIDQQTRSQSWMGYSFPPIIASGKNAQILHYHANTAPLDPNGLLLIDMGVRYETMPSDITRTIPVNGRFNPLQALLYTIVLDAQSHVESLVKPGVTIDLLNNACWDYIETQLSAVLTAGNGTLSRAYKKSPHNVSHLIGLAVHDGDPQRHYRTMPLVPGMVISNEPGFYGDIELTIDGKQYKDSIGIRIEDNLLITQTSCQNLTPCPKTIQDIEALF
tara:strand:- start:171 stop:1547 length:1377 start_codon:yes stop_codon:yes gene_type:complete